MIVYHELFLAYLTSASCVGVSNWGGYAVACALYVLNLCPIHWRYLHSGLGLSPTPDQQSLWTACLPTVAKVYHSIIKK